MAVYGVITAAVARKIKALIAEYRKLVAEATAVEQGLVRQAKSDANKAVSDAKAEEQRLLAEAKCVINEAKAKKQSILTDVKVETDKLKNELIDKIAKL